MNEVKQTLFPNKMHRKPRGQGGKSSFVPQTISQGYKVRFDPLALRRLDKYERRPGEDSPIGLILCAGKKTEQIELLELDRSGIHVAEYLTVLPAKKILREKLHKAIQHARLRLTNEN